jgi:DNA gyrase subunit B
VQNRLIETVDGVEVSPMRVTGDTDKRGTEVHFLPDTEIFKENNEFHYEILAKRLRELSFLNNGVRIRLVDERSGKEDDFSAPAACGLRRFINGSKKVLHPNPFYATGSRPAESYGGIPAPRSASKWPCSGTTATTSRCCASPTTSRSATAAPT